MENKSKSGFGKALFGAGGLTALAAIFCCGMPWVLAGLFTTLGLSFLLQDSVLMLVMIVGVIVAFIGWRILRK